MVLDGKLLASLKVIKASRRHLRDLLKMSDDSFPFTYVPDHPKKVVGFLEILPDVKTGEPYPLALFQKFIIGNIYGWKHKKDQSLRRFKKAFISMARKSGKTILVAGIILYELLFGQNPAFSRQIFCTANDKKQAKIAFEMARKQLDALRGKYEDIRKMTKRVREELKNLDDESYVMPLSKETGAVDGFEPYLGILDEYAASKTTEMIELLESGQGQLDNPLILIISTAGNNLNAPMHTIEYPRADKILNGEIEDEEYFAFIAEQDSEKEVEDEKTWIKSNPILEVESLYNKVMTYLRKRLRVGKETGELNKILIKNFNMWRQASEESYMSGNQWQTGFVEKAPDITGKDTWFGVDVGRSSDLMSISWLVRMDGYWYSDSYSFIATKYGLDTKIKRDGVDYIRLSEKGECEITALESGVIDYDAVYDWLENFVFNHELNVKVIAYDPYQFGHILTMIEKYRPEWPMAEVRQGTMTLSMPTKQLRDDVMNGKMKHNGNELLTAAINNAVTKSDNNGLRIDKDKNSNKIDPIDALLDAFAICYTLLNNYTIDDDYVMSDDFGF
ncbi:terminase TerL endonuclease subunit [Carnobacterium sp. ISL-102]|uniref:terminase large subunit n=1 Tax=Carnobacterium sp. ISL-102 TaxID=2819142 RepID=UPI001BE52A17|nr:terminase TerL endonuclease subunit [Carnobacterium sp. ISL-102]MBT2732109.1 terminase large subunit [Carnobacterium sp. ISL-102]